MIVFKATLEQLKKGDVFLEEIKNVFQKLDIKTLEDFKHRKKEGIIKVPSFDNLNALCLIEKGEKFEKFFFGCTTSNKKKETNLIDESLIEKVKIWCADNNITTLNEYRQKKHPPDFPTYKSTVDNYGEDYFYEVLGLKKQKENFSDKIINDDFINTLRDWCLKNKITSRIEYNRKRPDHFPSLERLRQLTLGSDYFVEQLELDFESKRQKHFVKNIKMYLQEKTSQAIQEARIQKKLSQAEISEKAGLEQSNFSKIERGKKDIRLSTLERIADAMEMEVEIKFKNKN